MARHSVKLSLLLGALLSAVAGSPVSAQQATIVGRVTDGLTGQVVAEVQVMVVGTNQGGFTNAEGRYVIRGVAQGAITLRATRLGYGDQTQEVSAIAGQTTQADFTMGPVPHALTGMVVTATGQQRRVEVGNAITRVEAASIVQTRAPANMADLLLARAPGVMVVPGTATGVQGRIRIRGMSSLSLSRDPIFVIDGVRMESSSGSNSISVGGTNTSRVSDINPEEIESMEVVKGPSAATLYGTDAANGVIVITTKRGVAGRPQWTYYTEQTAITEQGSFPDAYRGWRTGSTSSTTSTVSNTVQCFLSQVVAGTCLQDSVTSYNLHEDKESTPYGTGYRQQHGLQVRGGNEAVRYFLHGEWEDERGTVQVPEFEKRWMARKNLFLTEDQQNQQRLKKVTFRANVNMTLTDALDLAVSSGYITQDLRLPEADDSGTAGITANTYGGPGFKYNLNTAGDTLYGWREFTPYRIYQRESVQEIERFINSINGNYRPTNWLAFRGNFGLDFVSRHDWQICRFEECTHATDRLGWKDDNRHNFFVYTVDMGGTATRQINDETESQTSIGVQLYRNVFVGNYASGETLPPGAQTVSAGAVRSGSETTTESRTLGAYIEQRVSWRDKLFLTGAVRSDRNSAFGADFKTVFYPKLSVSWLLSDEDFFPDPGWLNQLRLRMAYGASGVQPGTLAALEYYGTTRFLGESGEVPGLVYSAIGNSKLKPERSTEIEVGFDASLFDNRLTAEVTYYDKQSKDALISRVLPPSLGGPASRLENLGQVGNKGLEALIEGVVLQRENLEWRLTFNASMNDNKLVSLGGLPTIVSSSTLQQREGYPIQAWWSRKLLSYEDKDGNGIISYNADPNLSEIVVSDTAMFTGRSAPKYEAAFTNGLSLWNGQVRLDAMFDYKGGHYMYNNTERIRCASRFNCQALFDPNTPLWKQARTVMVREHPSRSVAGFLESADFVRFRELSLTLSPPSDFLNGVLRGRTLTATLAARNLHVWTDYSGVDPEAYFGSNTDGTSEFQSFGPKRFYTIRLSLGF
ncbi:MAG: SusC/RagA family TonB-linked outer membrane protein [Longimicrobiales bacterium]|nr:SusC/RagA family TonB-linked outer membrane protein [Longimicrobiales bacterium]